MESPSGSPAPNVARLRAALTGLRSTLAGAGLRTDDESAVSRSLNALAQSIDDIEHGRMRSASDRSPADPPREDGAKRVSMTVDSVPGLVALLTTEGEVEIVNRQILDYTGQTLPELKQWGSNGTVHPEDLPHVIEVFSRSIASGTPYEILQRLRCWDGTYRWYQNNGFPIRDAGGQIDRWCVLLTDIHERKCAEDAVRERERELSLIVDSIPAGAAIMTKDGEVEFVNRRIVDYFGRSLEQLKGWSNNDEVHPDDLPRVLAALSHSVATGDPFDVEERLRRFDGVYRWFQVRGLPLRDADGQVLRWYVLHTDIDDRKRAEEAARANELNFQLTVDTIPGMVHTMTANGDIEFVNQQTLECLGATREELRTWGRLVHPDDRAGVIERWTHSVTAGEPFEAEHRVRCADGGYRWMFSRGLPLRDASGQIVRWYNLLTDVDERKRAEDALLASERHLKLIIDTMRAMAWAARPDGSAEFFNRHYLEFIGLSAVEASGWGWAAAVHPEDLDDLARTWRQILASEAPGEAEARLRRHDGEYRWFLFRANPLRDPDGAIGRWYGVNTDIEDRKRAEVDLRRAYDSFADAQRLSHTGNFTADIVADEHLWSEELYRIFEFDPSAKITVQAVREVIHPDDLAAFDAGFARSLGGADFDLVFRIVTRSGAVKHVRSLAHLTERDRPAALHRRHSGRDREQAGRAGAEHRARAELTHVTRVSSLSTLTASIAHEVNQPLSGIMTNARTCLRMLDADPPNLEGARETARRTIRDGDRASEVIGRVRALFSKRDLTLEVLDLNEAIREVVALSMSELRQSRIVVESELADDLAPITGDRIQLQQVILNLIRNATEAMVGVYDRPRHLLIRTEAETDGRVQMTVQDNGVGLAADTGGKPFDAFYTTKPDGMGIRLSISRSIVERHHGRISMAPNHGAGVAVLVSLPCAGVRRETLPEPSPDRY